MPRVSPDYVPSYRLHKSSGQAIVTLSAKDYLLGAFGSPASRVKYHEIVAKWLAGGRKPLGIPARAPVTFEPPAVTVQTLVTAYKRHVADYYRRPDGTPTTEVYNIGVAADLTAELFGTAVVDVYESDDAFKPSMLIEVRRRMTARGRVRGSVNNSVNRIKGMFRWGVEAELVHPAVEAAVRAVKALKRGRSDANESTPVKPVPDAYVDAIREHVAPPVWAMVQLQRLTGARGGELFKLRPIDIDTTGKLWRYRPTEHKTAHHDHERLIVFGPRAQAVLAPFMTGKTVDAYLFDPREGAAQRKAARATKGKGRRPGQKPNARKTARTVGNVYDGHSYRKAIQRACKLAGVESWHPHQLRHNFATAIRKRHGIETASVAVGHKSLDVTQIYAERDMGVIEKIARQIG